MKEYIAVSPCREGVYTFLRRVREDGKRDEKILGMEWSSMEPIKPLGKETIAEAVELYVGTLKKFKWKITESDVCE